MPSAACLQHCASISTAFSRNTALMFVSLAGQRTIIEKHQQDVYALIV